MAYSSSECACDADWTPQETIDLRAENAKLRYELGKCRDDYEDNHHTAIALFDKKEARYCIGRIMEIDKLLKQNEYSGTEVKK